MLDRPENSLSSAELEDIETISASGLFDSEWYYATHTDVATADIDAVVHYVKYGSHEGRNPSVFFNTSRYRAAAGSRIPPARNPFAHFILHGAPEHDFSDRGMMRSFSARTLQAALIRLSKLPVFSSKDYIKLNSDVVSADVLPAVHAFLYGFAEGRKIFHHAAVSRVLGRLSRSTPSELTFSDPAADEKAPPSSIGVYYNSKGNGFIREIAEDLVASLTAAGMAATALTEASSLQDRPPVSIIVGPHEFFHLGAGRDWVRDDVIRGSFMFNTEQPQTIWFERGVPFVLMSLGVIDICSQVAALFAEAGVPAMHFNSAVQPTKEWLLPSDMDHPLVRVLPKSARLAPQPETPMVERPIDISFFGGSSAHRDTFFTRNAAFLADYECFLYYRRFEGPHTNSKRDGILSRLGGHISAHSKVSLNIHRDEYGFFEWHRIVKLAMAGGSVVVSEPCLPHSLYKPNVHFFEESGRHMPDLLDWLLKSPDGQARGEEVRRNALALINDQDIISRCNVQLRSFISSNSPERRP
jgi:hypothetical protein